MAAKAKANMGGAGCPLSQGRIEAGGRNLRGIGRKAQKARPEGNQGFYSQQIGPGNVFSGLFPDHPMRPWAAQYTVGGYLGAGAL